jgi:hypothetical protein
MIVTESQAAPIATLIHAGSESSMRKASIFNQGIKKHIPVTHRLSLRARLPASYIPFTRPLMNVSRSHPV